MKQLLFCLLLLVGASTLRAQSTSQDFPTPVNSDQITATIAARDIGDARLTDHFYTFFAEQGDLNLSLESQNFDGDVDLFEAATLRPFGKITIVDNGATQKTARAIYFRKREQVVLRIEGRTLSDAAASYQIRFAGSFVAANLPEPPLDSSPKVAIKTDPNAVARVNSAGAIIETIKPETPIAANSAPEKPESKTPVKPAPKPKPAPSTVASRKPRVRAQRPAKQPPVTDDTGNTNKTDETTTAVIPDKPRTTATKPKTTAKARRPSTPKSDSATTKPDPLINIRLVIETKDGTRFERQMNEVFNVSVDKGQVTVITKDGKITRFNLLDVAKMIIE